MLQKTLLIWSIYGYLWCTLFIYLSLWIVSTCPLLPPWQQQQFCFCGWSNWLKKKKKHLLQILLIIKHNNENYRPRDLLDTLWSKKARLFYKSKRNLSFIQKDTCFWIHSSSNWTRLSIPTQAFPSETKCWKSLWIYLCQIP